jgi:hypothetical protein
MLLTLLRKIFPSSHNIREVIPGWDDDYPDPYFNDEWSIDVDNELYETEEIDINYLGSYSQDDQDFLSLIEGCTGCKYFCYNEADFICPIHPYGNRNCPDFESKYQ